MLRQLSNRYENKVQNKRYAEITKAEREAQNAIFSIWRQNAEADASEGLRPWPARSRRKLDRASAVVGRPGRSEPAGDSVRPE